MLLTLSSAAGVIFPFSPAGLLLQAGVGVAGAPLVPAWLGWVAWSIARRRRPSVWRVTSLLVLSATWVLALALREPQGGGLLGETLLDQLDQRVGHNGGLALVSLAAAAAAVHLVGPKRIFSALGRLAGLRVPRFAFRVARFAFRVARWVLRLRAAAARRLSRATPICTRESQGIVLQAPRCQTKERATRNAQRATRNPQPGTLTRGRN